MTNVQVKDMIFAGEIGEVFDTERKCEPKAIGELSKDKTQGRNKGGCLWKKGRGTKFNNCSVTVSRKSWEQKVKMRNDMKSLKLRMAELNESRKNQSVGQRKLAKERAERKKVNEMKSSKYVIIKNLSSTKKWHKKAKRTLTQLPAEIFYEKFKSTGFTT